MCGLLIAMGVINQVDADAIVLDELRILPARHPEVQDSDRKPWVASVSLMFQPYLTFLTFAVQLLIIISIDRYN